MTLKKIKFVLGIIILSGISAFAQAPKNLSLLSSIQFNGQTAAGCWHYEDSLGNAYALVGAANGIVIVDITNPLSPTTLFQLPGVNSLWHEVKVIGHYAYAVSEGSDPNGLLNGLQIIDLSYLPDSAPNKFYQGDGLIQNQLVTGHTVTTSGAYVFVNGHNISALNRGVLILDCTDPWNPVYQGAITNNYSHDTYVRNELLFSSEITAGQFSVFDISDKSNPVFLATQATPGAFNHNAWLSDNGRILFTTDERGNTPLGSFDVSNLGNITLLDSYYTINFPFSEVHNVRVLNDFLINPSYGSQLTIVDAARPDNLIEVANYTTGTYLCWDADPYPSSGLILATEMTPGTLNIFRPDYIRACYLEGHVTDSVSGIPLPAVRVQILGPAIIKQSNTAGIYKTGFADAGRYDIEFSRTGYNTKVIPAVQLLNGQVNQLNVELAPIGAGVNSNELLSDVKFFPTPFSDRLKLTFTEKPEQVSISSALGQIILRLNPENTELDLATDSWAKGIYLVSFRTKNGIGTKKLIKQ